MMKDVIDLEEKFALFGDHWSPRIVSESNGQQIKLAKVKGEFVWHDHKDEDELFFVVKGKLFIDLEDKTLELNEGQMTVIPRGVTHRPRTGGEECWIMLIEPTSTKHTGDVDSDLTKNEQQYL